MWILPIVVIQVFSVVIPLVVTAFWCNFQKEKIIASALPGVFVLLIEQSIAALLQKWAESNLD